MNIDRTSHVRHHFETVMAAGKGDHDVAVIRSGGKTIEFDKGKSAIVVQAKEKVPTLIETLTAVRGGELDDQLAQARCAKVMPKRTAA